MNLVVVSNRVARATANEPMTGGLAAALLPVVEKSGAIWVGSSGRVRDGAQKDPFAQIEALGTGALAMLDLPAAHYGGYYEGFANSALWPALHSRPDLIRVTQDDYQSYREVNAFMARALLRFRKPDTVFWIQDYHFLALGAELRDQGVDHPLGFFLHTPWPSRATIGSVPHHRELIEAMLAYDLIGFQTDEDQQNFLSYLKIDLGLRVSRDSVTSSYGTSRCAVFPIGIDADKFAQQAHKAVSHPDVSRLRRSLNGEKLVIGVDRLDYSKGLINRINAFDRMLTQHTALQRTVSLLQIATPSRGTIEAYGNLQADLARLVSDVNGRLGEADWTPIRYLNKGFRQTVLAGLYRTAQVGLVTPLQDGMNLVAKEYVAAQNPVDPGVLVLSKFAGAANELETALLVNPHDIDGMARTLATALSMPLHERRMRWEAMMDKLRTNSIQRWFADFVDTLQSAHSVNAHNAADQSAIEIPTTVWPPRGLGGRDSARLN
ncbi:MULTISPECIES: alpha,alpha-trehalose-phosphate synthase (UDP-forming) [Rhodopseudomonas]|uniref:Trehalose-6-phosphate synthase n=1 Tax=Rhodopseudomonas palustris TaxID=1076 RepID=A0A0D7EYN1_RHOPL|nr:MULTISPECIES: alpha,alpha-trehalose-phosphate synthase (UDP-forming) [Rhodopseudomonas]KIZ45964.1 alpha,alpha-trehalose-phosphate synthase [Rhodopseudomonas palustris]MDF3811054.1 alpha,alpha-trehalose-phosphate synthase (UDP-forming) [Rhodopseudomonas sp. BAL398]WOK15950.1 alpha,alpha-trehalose-phosphate synthase (UDP-forming) [Rhodopseudomonas sp. BAL398]